MARLRWRVYFESLWSEDIPALLTAPTPKDMKAADRARLAKGREEAAALLKTLFPPDEDPHG